MKIFQSFFRVFFLVLSVVFSATFAVSLSPDSFSFFYLTLGVIAGAGFGSLLISIEAGLDRYNLKTFNLAMLGLFMGYLMGQAVYLVLSTIVDLTQLPMTQASASMMKVAIFLSTCYLGMLMTLKASEEIYATIPFVKLKPMTLKKKDFLLDLSILADSRLIDLASSGILDNHLILPKFLVKELQDIAANGQENQKSKARRSLEVIQKLETMPGLDMRLTDTNFSDVKEISAKLIKLARMLDCNILTADISRIEQSAIEGIRIVNIHALSNALKPLTQSGEQLNIKIQRYGKEPRQGVGYLDDGTMVVVNGGAEYIGETIKAQVLSVKHTSSGRMIFCNTADEALLSDEQSQEYISNLQTSAKDYFAL